MNIPLLVNRGQKYFDFERQYAADNQFFEPFNLAHTLYGFHLDGSSFFVLSSSGGGPNPMNRDLLFFRGRWKSYTP